jgi:hypothetical protein
MKRYVKHLAIMALAAGISLAGTAANASTSVNFGNTPGTGSFTDLFTFTVGANGKASSFVSSLLSDSTLTFSSFSILNESTNSLLSSGTVYPGGLVAFLGPVVLNTNTLYGLQIQGNNLLAGGSYTGTLTVKSGTINNIALVPEPSTWAMMLGGLGLIGFMSYRRRQYF